MQNNNSSRIQNCKSACAAILLACGAATSSFASNIVSNDVTAVLWPSGAPFTFFDSASTGGGDTAAATSISFDRSLGTLNVGPNGTQINIRGIGWASGGASSFNATNVIGTITYLGADGVSGGVDDVILGKVTNNVTANANAGKWVWVFDSPITKIVDGLSNVFRINLTVVGTGNMKFKTSTSGTSQPASAVKTSVAGASTPYSLPTALDRVWQGNLSSTWNTSALNWTNSVLGTAANYTNGTQVTFDDTLATGTLNTNITLSATHTPLSVTVNNSSYDYSLSGGSLSGAMALTKYGSRALTLNMANDFSGGSTLVDGVVRLGNANGLGVGQINLNGGNLSSDGATARIVTNAILFSGASALGNAVANGTLTMSGPINFGGLALDLAINSPVTFSGSLTNGGLDEKTGSATLTFSGVTGDQSAGSWQIENGDFVIKGGNMTKSGGPIRIGNTSVNGVSRMTITNGAVVNVTGAGLNARVGNDQTPVAATTSTNILDVAGTLAWVTNSGGLLVVGNAGQFAQVNLLSGGVLQISRFFPGTKNNELNLNGGTLAPTTNQTAYLSGLTNAFVRSGGVTFDTKGFDIGVDQSLLDGSGGGGLTKIGNGTLSLNGTNTYTGLTTVSGGSLGGSGSIGGSVSIAVSGTLAPGNTPGILGNLTISQNFTNAGTAFMELDASSLIADQVIGVVNAKYGGSLVVSNLSGTSLAAGQVYQLFTASGNKTGSFASITVLGTGAAGLAGTFNAASGQLTLVTGVVTSPTINQVTVVGGNFILQGTNGTPSATYSIITTTNLNTPIIWTTNTTGVFGAGGTFSNGLPLGSEAARFFQIKTP